MTPDGAATTTEGVARLIGMVGSLREHLAAALTAAGWSLADDDGDLGPLPVRVYALDGSLACLDRVQQTLLEGGDPLRANALVVVGTSALAQAAQLELPANWVLLPWPAPRGWLSLTLRRALQLADACARRDGGSGGGAPSPAQHDADELALALRASGMFDFEYDLATGVRRSGGRDAQALGGSPGDLNDALKLIHPDDRAQMREAFQRCRATGCRYHVELRVLLRDGQYRWIRSEGSVVDRSARHPGRLLGVNWDIHEEREAREAARSARQRLDQALTTAGMLSWDWTAEDGRRRVVGNGLGLPPSEDRLGIALEDLILPADLDQDLARFAAAVRNVERYQNELRIEVPGLGTRWLQLSGYPRRGASGQVVAVSGLGLDITRQRTMENELSDAHALLIDSLKAGRMYCWEQNLIDGSRRAIGPSQDILGIAARTIEDVEALIHPDDAAAVDARWNAAIANRSTYECSYRIIRPGGEVRWMQTRGNPILGPDGNVARISGVAVDVSDQRRIEQQLAAARHRLEAVLNAAKLNPWSIDLVTGTHTPGPRDVEFFGESIRSSEHFQSFVVTEDRALVASMRDPEFLASGKPMRLEFRVRHHNGAIRWLVAHAQSELNAAGQPVQLLGLSYDISEARQAQERLANSLTQLERVQTATHVVLWEWTRALGPRCYQSGGRELSGSELPRMHPADRRRVLRRLSRCARSQEVFDEEFRVDDGAGGYRWVAVQGARSALVPDGELTLSGVMIDVSARKRVAEELSLAEERLRRALDAAKMVCWDWHTDAAYSAGDHAARYSPAVARTAGNPVGGLVHPDDRERHQSAIADALSGRTPNYRCEFRLLRADGSITWLLSIGSSLRDSRGRVVGLTGVAIDISAQKGIEGELAESREWQRLAVEAGELNLWQVDVTTGERRSGGLVRRLAGQEPTRIAQIGNVIHPEDRERVGVAWQQSIDTGAPFNIDYRVALDDQVVRWLRVRGKCVRDAASGMPQMVGASMDITEQVQLETELRNAVRLARAASEAKSAFLASISHELRTPLNAVIGFSGLLLNSATDPAQSAHLGALNSAANLLYSLINDVLDFSRIEAGEMAIESTPFDLQECLETAIDMVAGAASSKGLSLLMTATGAVDDRVIGDPTRLRQVAVNLLSNATKFTERGMVGLELEATRAGTDIDLTLRVRDSGIGMTAAVLQQLFEPFRQGDVSTTRRFGGTGLGLSICKRLIGLMRGSIDVRSQPGVGTCFEVRLALPAADVAVATPMLGGLRVAVAAESTFMSLGLLRQLREFGVDARAVDREELRAMLDQEAIALDVLLVAGAATLTALAAAPGWPARADGSPLPVVELVAIDTPLQPRFGRHGERYVPLAQAIKPRMLYRALDAARGAAGVPAASVEMPATALRPPSRFAGLRVLVAEDNEINQTLILLQLKSFGVTATLAGNGHEALAALRRDAYDVVLMDVEMPAMDGMEAATHIRNDPELRANSPYVIAVTAHVLGDSRQRFIAAGMDDLISKPVIMDDLRAALDRVLARGVPAPTC